ncbi:MAG: hypothetical protein ACE5IH_02425 [Thermodesulfobacteriota bacterium]
MKDNDLMKVSPLLEIAANNRGKFLTEDISDQGKIICTDMRKAD